MIARLSLAAIAATVLLAAASPASACSLVPITPAYVNRAAQGGQAVWVGRVIVVTPEERPETAFGGPGGKATIVIERQVRGDPGSQIVVDYNTRPFCGIPWNPKVGDRLLVIRYPTGPRLFLEGDVAGTRYTRYFRASQ